MVAINSVGDSAAGEADAAEATSSCTGVGAGWTVTLSVRTWRS